MSPPTQKLGTRGGGEQVLQHAGTAARLLLNISDEDSNNPYLKSIAGISILVLDTVQSVKSNRSQCLGMLEKIHEIISALINICGDGAVLSPTILRNLSQFFDTLQKVHSYIRSQVDLGLFRRVLRHVETASLLEDCNAGLKQAIDVFQIQTGLVTTTVIADMKEHSELRHKELVELLQKNNISRSTLGSSQSSSSTLFLLPSSPKIFYGRDGEVRQLITMLLAPEPSRTAILGPGGIGKSSLALAVLHHEDLASRFGPRRYFISLESSTSASDMLAAIAAFFDIDVAAKVSRAIIKHLSSPPTPCVIVLDNLEDCWENLSSRSEVEEFLSLLSEISHLELMVTMRGAERPGRIKWTRPFLPPLDPLDHSAARQTFLDIAEGVEEDELSALLVLTDNLPLAITLMANVASFEGARSLLNRWAEETTTILSEGFDKRANLDKSIMVSLSSSRMLSNPHAQELLSLMSLLPDGISEEALLMMKLPFSSHVARSKSTLLRCSLIYSSPDGRLRTLTPIREYMREKFPPSARAFDGLRTYLYELASLFRNPMELPNRELIQRLSSEFTNVRAVANYALAKSLHLEKTARCIIDLLHFNASAKTGSFDISDAVELVVDGLGDLQLKGDYLLAQVRIQVGHPSCLPIASGAVQCFEEDGDLSGQARALYMLSSHLTLTGQFQDAITAADRGTRVAQQSKDLSLEALCYSAYSEAYRNMGDQRRALLYGSEARRLSQASGNMTAEVWVTQQYATCCAMVGDYIRAVDLCATITSILSALGLANLDVHVYRNTVNISAEILDRRTEYEAARALHMRIYNSRRATDDLSKAWDLLNIAQIDIELGDLVRGHDHIEAARRPMPPDVWNSTGLNTFADILEAAIDFHHGEYGRAERGFKRALTGSGWLDIGILAIERLSNLALKTEDLPSALRYSVLLLAAARKSHDLSATHQALRRLGDISLTRGDEPTALNLFQVALDGFKLMGIHRGTGDCLVRIGDVLNSCGDPSKAREMWVEARTMFETSSQNSDVALCGERLAASSLMPNLY
ncbi:hypothetical protein FB451DRAFT_1408738 [Mycena latifolia]|nr:hypothetical protein FB451DRAFT_1408738 [Mycena latifolia]